VVLQRKQRNSRSSKPSKSLTTTQRTLGKPGGVLAAPRSQRASGPNDVAPSPQLIAAQAGLLASVLESSPASMQALTFYRIPLFLLPIYKAAAVQYGVPWQILAAINEIETDFGNDQSVSSAGAVGWMQFMPATWLQYGVDALNAGYADPYNPIDAIFAAARYLRAAGAAKDLRGAIFAYNHSQEYVESVMLRAKLISAYPKAVIATLTGLVDARSPVTGRLLSWSELTAAPASPASATANATPAPSAADTPGSAPAPSPAAAAAKAKGAAEPMRMVDLTTSPSASVVAVQSGRVVQLGSTHALGKYLVLRDVYGDLFTYAGMGAVAPTYTLPKPPRTPVVASPVVQAASTTDPAPSQAATAGSQPPLTLQVKGPSKPSSPAPETQPQAPSEGAEAATGKVRLFAHPNNPDARALAASLAHARRGTSATGTRLPLRRGAVVATGTVLGRVNVPASATQGHLRFAIRPAGDRSTIDPAPILQNWAKLEASLHPRGAKGAATALLGATANDVLVLSQAELERTVLSDPGISLAACARQDIAAGKVDRRVLAVLAFLSRSGLRPAVDGLRCVTAAGGAPAQRAAAVDITAINGVAIAGHQGAGTVTDLTIRTLLTLPAQFLPGQIASLMRYPGAPNTHAATAYWNRIHLAFAPVVKAVTLSAASLAGAARSAGKGHDAPAPLLNTANMSAKQWNELVGKIGSLPSPAVITKPSSAAIPDPKRK
jgi:hypothetical protein